MTADKTILNTAVIMGASNRQGTLQQALRQRCLPTQQHLGRRQAQQPLRGRFAEAGDDVFQALVQQLSWVTICKKNVL